LKKLLGTLIAAGFLGLALYLSRGLFVGILLYIAQVFVLYVMKWLYGTGTQQSEIVT